MIDFKKKLAAGKIERKTDPVELYKTLDRKSVAGPLRPAQDYILNDWYTNHYHENNIIVKLHTGEGKTLIGLLMLMSKLNAKDGPCIYVCPNKYLVKQVRIEADKFGIPVCAFNNDKHMPEEFLSGEKILVTYAHMLFNGKTRFGIDNRCIKTGSIVLDDSHACIDIMRSAFTITLHKDKVAEEEAYSEILALFATDLASQREGSFLDIESGSYETFLPVPYWSWHDKKTEILSIILKYVKLDAVSFVWPLLRDSIREYSCYISGNKIEITPYNMRLETFGTFYSATHRIFMSATTQDDSFFIKGLGFMPATVRKPLTYPNQQWSGEKMIIIPSLLRDECDRDIVITHFCQQENTDYGIVAIVPSTRHTQQYAKLGAVIVTSDSMEQVIDSLRKRDCDKLIVLNNRYDGIDLPDETCRVLIIDSMPFFDSLADRYEVKCRPRSESINRKLAQKIEQGIGRGVRGEKDYCAVLIIGDDLVNYIRNTSTNKFFSSQTNMQITIGLEIAKMEQNESIDGSTIKPVTNLISQMINRDEGWKEYYTSQMDSIVHEVNDTIIYDRLLDERNIEELYSNEEYEEASTRMQKYLDDQELDKLEKGWYLQLLARYQYPIKKQDSIMTQKAAFLANAQLLKPKIDISYTQISYISQNRLNRMRELIAKYLGYTDFSLDINAVLDNLSFGIESDKFEEALHRIGELLGFVCQRPDRDIGKGFDNLWCGNNNHYVCFECKNEVIDTRKEINKNEAAQMNSHCAWFRNQYNDLPRTDYFMIIPTRNLSYLGDFSEPVRIIRRAYLNKLKESIKGFISELKPYDIKELSDSALQKIIDLHYLNIDDFATYYSEGCHHNKNLHQ